MTSGRAKRIETVSIRDQVYRQIRDLILDGSLPAGMRLDLGELTRSLGVSKTPLTEAMQALLHDGLVTVKPRSGTFVSQIDMEAAVRTFGYRKALEIGSAEPILASITDAQIAELDALNRTMADIPVPGVSASELRRFLHCDAEFHDRIIVLSGNAVICEKYRQARSLILVMRMQDRYGLDQFRAAVADHAMILDALRSRDLGDFRLACAMHVDRAVDRMRQNAAKAEGGIG